MRKMLRKASDKVSVSELGLYRLMGSIAAVFEEPVLSSEDWRRLVVAFRWLESVTGDSHDYAFVGGAVVNARDPSLVYKGEPAVSSVAVHHAPADVPGYDAAVGAEEASASVVDAKAVRRRARWASDPAFREKMLQRNRDWRARERAAGRSR